MRQGASVGGYWGIILWERGGLRMGFLSGEGVGIAEGFGCCWIGLDEYIL